jgi:hypothetical protein
MSPPLSHALRALALDVRIDVDPALPSEIAEAVWALTATHPRLAEVAAGDAGDAGDAGEVGSARHARRYELRASPLCLLRDGVPCAPAEAPCDLLLQLEMELLHDATTSVPPGWFLHAGAIEPAGRAGHVRRAIVLVGASGAGKSTMTLALVARGARYVSDELVLIDDAGVSGLARPIGFDPPFTRALPAGFRRLEHPAPEPIPGGGRAVMVHPPAASIVRGPIELGAIVALRHAPAEAPSLTRLAARDALALAWAETRRKDEDGLTRALATLARVPAYALITRAIDEACEAIQSLAAIG